MSELEKLFYQADHSSTKWQPYFEIYERHLNSYRDRPITMVEVGVWTGGSLDMWAQFLHPESKIIGIDINPECSKLEYKYPNVEIAIGDQSDPNFWDNFLKDKNIDVFLDDGGHHANQQLVTFAKVFPKLNLGGIYICEDTHTSYWPDYSGGLNSKGSFIEYSKQLIDVLHYDWKKETTSELELNKKLVQDGLSGLFFYDSMVVFEKFGKRKMESVLSK